MDRNGIIIQGLDPLDLTQLISRKNRKFMAIGLQEIEEILGKDTEEFKHVRQAYLNTFNNYTRSVVRAIFGDIEFN